MIHLVLRPAITEKSITLAQKGWFTFHVSPKSTKREVAREVSKLYKVTVTGVRTAMRHGKERRTGKKQMKTRNPDTKKALVRLQKGQIIPAFEVAHESEKK